MKKLLLILFTIMAFFAQAQKGSNEVLKGNEAYKKGDFKNAESEYDKALKLDSKNFTAQFNKANAMQKQGKVEEATKEYASASEKSNDFELQSKALYNKGVTEAKQKQWEQAANSFKKSLRLNPDDVEARDNLQKVMNEIKKQQQNKKPDENKKKDDKKDKEDKPKEKKQPKMNKQQMENELNRLRNEEKMLQQDLQKQKLKSSSPEKDW
jgi:Ca-activated chloride channel family protein